MTDAIAVRATVRELVAVFVAAERDVRAAFASIVAAEARVNAAFVMGEGHGRIHVSACGSHEHLSRAREMLQEAVREVWEWLRPRAGTRVGDLKTNTELEVGERVILGYMVERSWSGGWQINYSRRQNLIALENVFNGLAGNGEIAKTWKSAIEIAIEAAPSGEGETELFAFRACKNGNLHLHLRFKRLDLLARFNAMAAGRTLRPVETEQERLKREIAAARAENDRLKRDAARRAGAAS